MLQSGLSNGSDIDDASPTKAATGRSAWREASITAIAGALSTYFVVAACSLYWLTAGAGAVIAKVLPRALIEKAPLAWLAGSSLLVAAATQTVPGFFPEYSDPTEILAEIGLWLALGLFARAYLVATDYPPTFAGLRASIEDRPLERWLAAHLHNPIDAAFTRIWVANSIALIPLTFLLIWPSTINYFVIVALSVAMLLSQFPHEVIDHTNIHTRVFQPRIGASPRIKLGLRALQLYFETVLSMLVARTPYFYSAQHLFVHHAEGNGPNDTQTTEPYDRTSFLDFARHAFRQGIHLVTGVAVCRHLWANGKNLAARRLIQGLAAWYAIIALIAAFNPIGALMLFASRFLGGNVQSLVAFWQHGLVDPDDRANTAANTIDFTGAEHGNLGNDYHVEHHEQPGRHWSKYYELFSRQDQTAGGHPAVVFHKDTFAPLAFVAALWRRDYEVIAAAAHLHGMSGRSTHGLDQAALVAEVEKRTWPIGAARRNGLPAAIDRRWSRLMALAMPVRFTV